MCKRHQGSTRQPQPKSWLQITQRIIRLLILTRFPYSEKDNTVFTDPKDRQVKHYYPNKKAVILSIGSGLKEFLRIQRNQESFDSFLKLKNMEFVLTRNHFCNLCWRCCWVPCFLVYRLFRSRDEFLLLYGVTRYISWSDSHEVTTF